MRIIKVMVKIVDIVKQTVYHHRNMTLVLLLVDIMLLNEKTNSVIFPGRKQI